MQESVADMPNATHFGKDAVTSMSADERAAVASAPATPGVYQPCEGSVAEDKQEATCLKYVRSVAILAVVHTANIGCIFGLACLGMPCVVRQEMRWIAAAFVFSAVSSATLAYSLGQVRIFPVELSITANAAPSYWVFAIGLTMGVILNLATYRVPSGWPERFFTITFSLGMIGLAWIADGWWQQAHQFCGAVCFLSMFVLAFLRRGVLHFSGAYLGAAFYVLHELCSLPWCRRRLGPKGVKQAHGFTQWCAVLCLLVSL